MSIPMSQTWRRRAEKQAATIRVSQQKTATVRASKRDADLAEAQLQDRKAIDGPTRTS